MGRAVAGLGGVVAVSALSHCGHTEALQPMCVGRLLTAAGCNVLLSVPLLAFLLGFAER